MSHKLLKATKHYKVYEILCNCHRETCCHFTYELEKDSKVISKGDYIKGLNYPNTSIRYKILDLFNYSNHKDENEYKLYLKGRHE